MRSRHAEERHDGIADELVDVFVIAPKMSAAQPKMPRGCRFSGRVGAELFAVSSLLPAPTMATLPESDTADSGHSRMASPRCATSARFCSSADAWGTSLPLLGTRT